MTKDKIVPSPPGIRVPKGGSSCAKCMYIDTDTGNTCVNTIYVSLTYKGKKKGDDRFIDGKTGKVVKDPSQFCCNVYDW